MVTGFGTVLLDISLFSSTSFYIQAATIVVQ